MNVFQIIFVPVCAAAALVALYRARQGRSGWLAGLFWAGVWTASGLAIAAPDIPSALARLLGIGRGADLVAYMTVLALLLITRFFYSRHRQTQNMLTTLAREVAIAEAREPRQPPCTS